MEKIKLSNGSEKSYITAQNDSWKFYYCDTYEDAKELQKSLSNDQTRCEIADNSRGWFVRVQK